MRILFVNQTYMEWYRGANNFDHPSNGGAWVKEHGDDSADTYNFCPFGTEDGVLPLQLNDGTQLKLEGVLCLAYVSTTRTKDGSPKLLHLEKIRDCRGCTKDDYVDDVLVVFCAKRPGDAWPTVVGWYRNAYVFRYHLDLKGIEGDPMYGNIIAKAKDVVLLPMEERKWRVYRAPKDGFGFGQSNYWFANEEQSPKVKGYVEDIVHKIETYEGENLMDYRLCPNCGSIVPMQMKYCDQCGHKMFLNANAFPVDLGEAGADALRDVARAISGKGIVGISEEEFEDLLKGVKYTAVSVGFGAGAEAAPEAAEAAMQSIVSRITDKAKGILLIVSGAEKYLDMVELKKAQDAVQSIAGESAQIILCANYDNTLEGDTIRVTLVACE